MADNKDEETTTPAESAAAGVLAALQRLRTPRSRTPRREANTGPAFTLIAGFDHYGTS